MRRLILRSYQSPGDILMLHDTASALTARRLPTVLEVLPNLLRRLRAEGYEVVPLPPAHEPLRARPVARSMTGEKREEIGDGSGT